MPEVKASFKVDGVWETSLEPGTWYRIIDGERPRIICGYVFVPEQGKADFRSVDGKILPSREHVLIEMWVEAILSHRNYDPVTEIDAEIAEVTDEHVAEKLNETLRAAGYETS